MLRTPAVSVTWAALFLMRLPATGTATVPVLHPLEVARWIRDHSGLVAVAVAATVVVVGLVLIGIAGLSSDCR